MTQRFTRGLVRAALVLAVVVAGCGDAGGPAALVEPRFDAAFHQLEAVSAATGSGYLGAVKVDGGGAVIGYGAHRLVIPDGAVTGPVVFEFWLIDKVVGLKMTATAEGSSTANDVGSAGFAKPLKLTLSYADATRAVDLTTLTVAYRRDDGGLDPIASTVDTAAETVTAQIDHFSGYIVSD